LVVKKKKICQQGASKGLKGFACSSSTAAVAAAEAEAAEAQGEKEEAWNTRRACSKGDDVVGGGERRNRARHCFHPQVFSPEGQPAVPALG